MWMSFSQIDTIGLMSSGPHLIFDKSALQCLSLDETNWLDNFFYTVITPLFFAQTLGTSKENWETNARTNCRIRHENPRYAIRPARTTTNFLARFYTVNHCQWTAEYPAIKGKLWS